MNRKELHDFFCEASSRCAPIRGIYSAPPTERERLIRQAMQGYLNRELKKKEAQTLISLFEKKLAQIQSKQELIQLLQTVQQFYHPTEIPDTVYVQFMTLAHTYDCTELLPEVFHS